MIADQGTLGVTRSVLWDSGVVLGKFLEHAVELATVLPQGKKFVELGSGYRLRMLRKNVGTNFYKNVRGCAAVSQLIWREEPIVELIRPLADYGTKILYLLFHITKGLLYATSCLFGDVLGSVGCGSGM
ncbi:hypothetical protein LOK49_LG15G02144 [Camellia lanceoleosa]|uniref:Uncharacterized protein n=1 Tax=Camellia lanceoleosa TaxID=1840588 RepID=A0ACC0F2Z5_9ERIC|nr:hypothetical protein LOK49_LG15G02144 [Camellia lanceoleosa]